MAEPKLISADSHVNEPGDLWVERIDKHFRDRLQALDVCAHVLEDNSSSPSARGNQPQIDSKLAGDSTKLR